MLGNDVIDLDLARRESNWRRKGYLEKTCSPAEQQDIRHAEDPFLAFWMRWSMKESAYKIVNRLTHIRSFDPSAYCCTLRYHNGTWEGEVRRNDLVLYTRSCCSSDFIHTSAVQQYAQFAAEVLVWLDNYPDYQARYNADSPDDHLYKDDAGIPWLLHRETGQIRPASLSHHGRYLVLMYSGFLRSAG